MGPTQAKGRCLLVDWCSCYPRPYPGWGTAILGFKERASQSTCSQSLFQRLRALGQGGSQEGLPALAMLYRSPPCPHESIRPGSSSLTVCLLLGYYPFKLQEDLSEPSQSTRKFLMNWHLKGFLPPFLPGGCLASMQIYLPFLQQPAMHNKASWEMSYIRILFHPSPGAMGACVPFACLTIWDHLNDYPEKEDPLCPPTPGKCCQL